MEPEIKRDVELEAKLLRRFCGWRWLRENRHNLCGFYPPHDAEVGDWQMCPLPKVESDIFRPVDGIPPVSDRYSDWVENCCLKQHGKKYQSVFGMPSISTSMDECHLLMMSLTNMGFLVEMGAGRQHAMARIFNVNTDLGQWFSNPYYKNRSSALAMSICQAADSLPE